jgi:hypothetical protein
VLFIAATADAKFRAFESRTSKELRLTKLDFGWQRHPHHLPRSQW